MQIIAGAAVTALHFGTQDDPLSSFPLAGEGARPTFTKTKSRQLWADG
jgi:hypothetical protein